VTTRAYRPSCGTEGADFMEEFCYRCEKDRAFRETDDGAKGCQIVSDTFFYEVNDPLYPTEWIHDEAGPRCTAFEPERLARAARSVPVPHPSSTEPAWLTPNQDFVDHSTEPLGSDPKEPDPAAEKL
jgi:hypothetical protein